MLEFFGKPKISTITKPGVHFDLTIFNDFIPIFFACLGVEVPDARNTVYRGIRVSSWSGRILTKSGPGVSTGLWEASKLARWNWWLVPINTTAALISQAVALSNDPTLLRAFERIAKFTNQNSLVLQFRDVLKWAR